MMLNVVLSSQYTIQLVEFLHIYVRGLGKRRILKIRIPANNIFIGRNTLVHAGSETVGMRYHGKLVPIGESEKDVEDEVILFEQDDSYPSVRD